MNPAASIREVSRAASGAVSAHLQVLYRAGGLSPAAEVSMAWHESIGWALRADVRRVRLRHPSDPARFWRVSVVPARASRPGAQAGTPPGGRPVRVHCVLCDTSRGRADDELHRAALHITPPGGEPWMLIPNRYPSARLHCLLLPVVHQPQSWLGSDVDVSVTRLRTVVRRGLWFLGQLPGCLMYWNGAGATQPHLHLHAISWSGTERFPIEEAARAAKDPDPSIGSLLGGYALPVRWFKGSADDVVAALGAFVGQWLLGVRALLRELTFNLILSHAGPPDCFQVFFIARSLASECAAGLPTRIASQELAGDFVISDESSICRLERGELDYAALTGALASLQTPGISWSDAGRRS